MCPSGGTTYHDSVMSIHTGCAGTSDNTLACDDDGRGNAVGPSRISNFPVAGGTTHQIRISGWNGWSCVYAFGLTGPACYGPTPGLDLVPNGARWLSDQSDGTR